MAASLIILVSAASISNSSLAVSHTGQHSNCSVCSVNGGMNGQWKFFLFFKRNPCVWSNFVGKKNSKKSVIFIHAQNMSGWIFSSYPEKQLCALKEAAVVFFSFSHLFFPGLLLRFKTATDSLIISENLLYF